MLPYLREIGPTSIVVTGMAKKLQFRFDFAANDLEVALYFAEVFAHAGAHGDDELYSRHFLGAVQALVDKQRCHEIDSGLYPEGDGLIAHVLQEGAGGVDAGESVDGLG